MTKAGCCDNITEHVCVAQLDRASGYGPEGRVVSRGFGRIVNTTSGIDKEPEQAGYSAAKAALDKITKDMASRLGGTGVAMNLVDPGWCRTDLGGPNAPNAPESALPGIIAPAFTEDKVNGQIFHAQDYCGMDLEAAVGTINSGS